jgi:tyrosyl-tRNA synthetase
VNTIAHLLKDSRLVDSLGEARRLAAQGGVSINGVVIKDVDVPVTTGQRYHIRIGRWKQMIVYT